MYGKPEGYICKMYSLNIPKIFLEQSKIISMKRNIDVSEFVREAVFNNIKKYEHILSTINVKKPR